MRNLISGLQGHARGPREMRNRRAPRATLVVLNVAEMNGQELGDRKWGPFTVKHFGIVRPLHDLLRGEMEGLEENVRKQP